jgi:hypothetical protein
VPITRQWSFVSKALLDARDDERQRAARESWQDAIDRKLIEWGRTPSPLEDIGVDPPTKETIQRAIRLAEVFRDEGLPGPESVVPDPNGGIVFERREGDVAEVCHLWDDGTTEYQRFEGTRLVERRTL